MESFSHSDILENIQSLKVGKRRSTPYVLAIFAAGLVGSIILWSLGKNVEGLLCFLGVGILSVSFGKVWDHFFPNNNKELPVLTATIEEKPFFSDFKKGVPQSEYEQTTERMVTIIFYLRKHPNLLTALDKYVNAFNSPAEFSRNSQFGKLEAYLRKNSPLLPKHAQEVLNTLQK